MTPGLKELLSRDVAALETDLDMLRNRIAAVKAAVQGGDLHVVPHRAVFAAEIAQRMRDRLVEAGMQTSNCPVPPAIPLGNMQ